MADLPDSEREFLGAFVRSEDFVYATTYAKSYPHEYIVRRDVRDKSGFDRFHRLITSFGHIQNFYQTARPYLIFDGWKYWRMDRVLAWNSVVNRQQPPGQLFGRQWAPSIRLRGEPTAYDWLAPKWPESGWITSLEAAMVADLLAELSGPVLNIGCGTGEILRRVRLDPEQYLGIDVSQGMLNVHIENFPAYEVRGIDLMALSDEGWWPNVLALWGTGDHLSNAELAKAQAMAGEFLLLMFHGSSVEPVAPVNPEAWDFACGLPGMQEMPIGRWRALVSAAKLF